MEDLIRALQIFLKYEKGDVINCDHDELNVCIDPGIVSTGDLAELDKLGFFPADDNFKSFRFGSC